MTREHVTAFTAISAALLVAVLAVLAGAGLDVVLGAGLFAYIGTLVVAARRASLHLGRVVRLTSRGLIAVAVFAVIVVIGVAKAVMTVSGVAG